jgi:hypothetical protein
VCDISTYILLENLMIRSLMEDLDRDGMTILKCVLKEQDERLWTCHLPQAQWHVLMDKVMDFHVL